MNKQRLFNLACLGLLLVALSVASAQAQTPTDQFDYPACNCIPQSARAFDGSGSEGFLVHSGLFFPTTDNGIFLNFDNEHNELLFCPIVYDHRFRRADGSLSPLTFQVDVIDNHAGDEVLVEVFGRTTLGGAVLLGTANTANPFTGRTTLTITVTPGTSIRYLWLRINVPDSNPGSESGVIGYRVSRSL